MCDQLKFAFMKNRYSAEETETIKQQIDKYMLE